MSPARPPRSEPDMVAFPTSDSPQGGDSLPPSGGPAGTETAALFASGEAGVTKPAPASPFEGGSFANSLRFGPRRQAVHVVADIHFGPHNGPSWLRCQDGALLHTRTAEAMYRAWVTHGGKTGRA